jgi:hypothetical protein
MSTTNPTRHPPEQSVFLGYPFLSSFIPLQNIIAITLVYLGFFLRSADEPYLFGQSIPQRILVPYRDSQFSIHWLESTYINDHINQDKIDWVKYHLTLNPTTLNNYIFDMATDSNYWNLVIHNKNSKINWNHIRIPINDTDALIQEIMAWSFVLPHLQDQLLYFSKDEIRTLNNIKLALESFEELTQNSRPISWENYLDNIYTAIDNLIDR